MRPDIKICKFDFLQQFSQQKFSYIFLYSFVGSSENNDKFFLQQIVFITGLWHASKYPLERVRGPWD